MSGYTFEKRITLGNLIQIAVIIAGIFGAYFAIIGDVKINEQNILRIEKTVEQNSEITRKIDVIENEIGHISQSLQRLEQKLDE